MVSRWNLKQGIYINMKEIIEKLRQNSKAEETIKNYDKWTRLEPDEIGSHSLRSGCATYLLDKGIRADIVQKHMRHKKFDSTQVYNKNKTAKNLEGIY